MEYIFVWQTHGYKKIALDEIILLKAARSYCEIYLEGKGIMVVSLPLSDILTTLNSNHFVRIHRSYAVNLKYVDSITGNSLVLSDKENTRLLIGREYRKNIFGIFPIIGPKSRKIK